MNPIYLALGFSFSHFFYTIAVKKLFHKGYRPIDIMRFWMSFTGIASLIALFFTGIHIKSNLFYVGLVGFTICTMLGHFFQLKAISKLPVSIVSPLGAFYIIFVTIIATFTLVEKPTLIGLFGILLVFIGSYALNLKSKNDFLMPLLYLIKNKNVWFKHLANLFWAFSATFLKISITNASLFSGIFILSATVGILSLASFIFYRAQKKFFRQMKMLLSIGLLRVSQTLFEWTLLTIVFLGYATSLGSIDLILLVLAGKFYFKEKQGWERIIAAVIVYVGIQLILLFG